jgi:sulfatase maturation enzyme AslB (radical SAM superfamily)
LGGNPSGELCRTRHLVLWLTTACNLRCAYCYRGEPADMTMPMEVARAALALAGASRVPFHVQLAAVSPP